MGGWATWPTIFQLSDSVYLISLLFLGPPFFSSHLLEMKKASELSEGRILVVAIQLLPQISRVFP